MLANYRDDGQQIVVCCIVKLLSFPCGEWVNKSISGSHDYLFAVPPTHSSKEEIANICLCPVDASTVAALHAFAMKNLQPFWRNDSFENLFITFHWIIWKEWQMAAINVCLCALRCVVHSRQYDRQKKRKQQQRKYHILYIKWSLGHGQFDLVRLCLHSTSSRCLLANFDLCPLGIGGCRMSQWRSENTDRGQRDGKKEN